MFIELYNTLTTKKFGGGFMPKVKKKNYNIKNF